ncbi:MAG: trypsin-like peptidase domain-containing protein [Solirubrobacterales bacterium]|nr:trypsin-like peptidase domain-containing protein [Solirubrobacterales bacterium]
MVLALSAPAFAQAQGQGNRPPDNVLGATDAVVAVHTSVSNGAGFVLEGAEAEVITHDAVVRSDETVRVTTIDGRELEGTVVGRDEEAGLAVLSVPGVRVGTIPLASQSAEDGDDVWAVGRPLGYSDRIAAVDVEDLSGELAGRRIELDGPVTGDGLGGPLINGQGDAVGIVVADAQDGARAVPVGRAARVERAATAEPPPWMAIGAGVVAGLVIVVAFVAWVTSRSKRRWVQRFEDE